jgi:hypothetical protein
MRALVILLTALIVTPGLAQIPFTPATPAMSPPSPALVPPTPALVPPTINPVSAATNATLAALSESLASLQTNIEQTLPILINFNDSFDFVSIMSGGAVSTAGNPNPPGNFAVNSGVNFATNFGVNFAVPTGPGLFNNRPNTAGQSSASTAQGVATLPVTRDVLRALLVLQSDMQRMLPVLNALNGGSTNLPGGFAALFSTPATSP